jgi:hypothetical protein
MIEGLGDVETTSSDIVLRFKHSAEIMQRLNLEHPVERPM